MGLRQDYYGYSYLGNIMAYGKKKPKPKPKKKKKKGGK